jgi:hypothetical protein
MFSRFFRPFSATSTGSESQYSGLSSSRLRNPSYFRRIVANRDTKLVLDRNLTLAAINLERCESDSSLFSSEISKMFFRENNIRDLYGIWNERVNGVGKHYCRYSAATVECESAVNRFYFDGEQGNHLRTRRGSPAKSHGGTPASTFIQPLKERIVRKLAMSFRWKAPPQPISPSQCKQGEDDSSYAKAPTKKRC